MVRYRKRTAAMRGMQIQIAVEKNVRRDYENEHENEKLKICKFVRHIEVSMARS